MSKLKAVRMCLKPVLVKNKILELYRFYRKSYLECDLQDMYRKKTHFKLWGRTLAVNDLFLLAGFFNMLFVFSDKISVLWLIVDGLGIIILSIAIYDNNQEINTINMFIYNKQQEQVINRILELLIETNLKEEKKE